MIGTAFLPHAPCQPHQDVYPSAASGVFASLDRDKVKRDPKATMMALAINGFALAGVLWLGAHTIAKSVLPAPAHVVTLVAPLPPPPPLPKAPPKVVTMSGGGGHPMAQPVTRGNPPALAPKPVMLVSTAPPRIQPRLAIQPTLNVQPTLKLAKADVPALGMATGAPAVTVSLGNGAGAGIGAGSGNGLGSGSGGNYGGGVFKVGGGVAAPTVISAPEPTFTEEARQAKVSGKVVVYLQVSPDGHPMHVRGGARSWHGARREGDRSCSPIQVQAGYQGWSPGHR